MRRLSRVVATVVSVAVIGLAAGCGGDNPTPSAAPSASPSSPPPGPPIESPGPPDNLDEKNRRGAIAAVRYFLTAMEYAGDSGDAAALRATFSGSCTKCEAIAAGIERTYAAGGSIRGGGWRPTSFKFYGIREDVAYLDAAVDYEAQDFVAKRGARAERTPARRGILKAFQLTWDSGWTVGALDPQA